MKIHLRNNCAFGFNETRTSSCSPQGKSVLDQVQSTIRIVLAMYTNVQHDNWAEILPFVQLAHKTVYHKTLKEAPHFLRFGLRAASPIEEVSGATSNAGSDSQLDYSRSTAKIFNSRMDSLVVIFESDLTNRQYPTRYQPPRASSLDIKRSCTDLYRG